MQTRNERLARSSLRIALSLAAAALVAACGSGNAPAAKTETPSGGGVVTPQGSGSNTDGTSNGGTPSGGGTGTTTPTDEQTSNTNGGGTSNGGGGTPADGGGGTVEPTPNPCDGLVPTFGAPTRMSFPLPAYAGCPVATSSPWGQVELGRSYKSEIAFDLYSATGENQGRITGFTNWYSVSTWPDLTSWFSWTSDGYVGIAGGPPQVTVWDNRGARVALGPTYAIAIAPDGAGGTVALTRYATTELWWLDSWAHRIRSTGIEGSPSLLIVNWLTHHVLTVETSSTVARAQWYDGLGAPLGGWIPLGSEFLSSRPTMHLLVDGSVALAVGGRWRLLLREGASSPDPAPAWLADLSTTRLATIRDGKGYAALSANGSVDVLQILTADGVSCATLTVPNAGNAWHPARIDVGQDGTLIEILDQPPPSYPTPANASGACMFQWWPALLR